MGRRRRLRCFIDTDYTAQRLHSALDYLAPEEFEQKQSGGRQMEKSAPLNKGTAICRPEPAGS